MPRPDGSIAQRLYAALGWEKAQIAATLIESQDLTDPRGGQPYACVAIDAIQPTMLDEVGPLTLAKRMWGGPMACSTVGSSSHMPSPGLGQRGLLGYGVQRSLIGGTSSGVHPSMRAKTIEYAWPNRITQLATNTTLGTSTVHTTASQTIYIPETGERVFQSVQLMVSYRSEYGATNNIIGWRMQATLGAAGTLSIDRAVSPVATANQNVYDVVNLDLTDYFNANFGSGTSQTCTAGIAVATTNAANINNITFRLIVTYAFNPSMATTRIKTVRIPIGSNAGLLPTIQTEIGIDGTSPAPSNQIPALTGGSGILPENTPTIRQAWLEITSNDCINVGAVGSSTAYVQIDAIAEVARATLDATLAPNVSPYVDNYDLTGLGLDFTAAHSFSMRSDTANRYYGLSAILHVTYEYNHSATTTALYSMIVPMEVTGSENINGIVISAGATADQLNATVTGYNSLSYVANVDVHEPGPITMVQSGFMYTMTTGNGVTTFRSAVNQVPARTFTNVDTTTMARALGQIIHRADVSGGWTLARGSNRLLGYHVSSQALTARSSAPLAYVNYKAGVRVDVDSGARMLNYMIKSNMSSATATLHTVTPQDADQKTADFGSPYKYIGVSIEANSRSSAIVVTCPTPIMNSAGNETTLTPMLGWLSVGNTGALTTSTQGIKGKINWTHLCTQDSLHSSRPDPRTKRQFYLTAASAASEMNGASWWLGAHNHAFVIAAAVTINGSPAPDGNTVEIYAYDPNSQPPAADLVTTATISGGAGAFSCTVPDNTRTYFASYNDGTYSGRSPIAVPS